MKRGKIKLIALAFVLVAFMYTGCDIENSTDENFAADNSTAENLVVEVPEVLQGTWSDGLNALSSTEQIFKNNKMTEIVSRTTTSFVITDCMVNGQIITLEYNHLLTRLYILADNNQSYYTTSLSTGATKKLSKQ